MADMIILLGVDTFDQLANLMSVWLDVAMQGGEELADVVLYPVLDQVKVAHSPRCVHPGVKPLEFGSIPDNARIPLALVPHPYRFMRLKLIVCREIQLGARFVDFFLTRTITLF